MLKKTIKLGRFQFALPVFLVFTCGALLAILTKENFNLTKFLFGYFIFLLAQLSVQYSNDYFDYDVDRLTSPTFFSGGSKVLQDNETLKIFSKWISIFFVITSIILSILFVLLFKVSIKIIIMAVFANFLGWFYTAPPLKLSYRGLGEIVIILTVAVILPIAGFITIQDTLNKEIIVILVPLLLYTAMLAIAVQIPDYRADRIAGKKNLVSVYGRKAGFLFLFIFSLAASLYFIILAALNLFNRFYYYNINFILLVLISLPTLITSIIGFIIKPSKRKNIASFIGILFITLVLILFIFNIHLIILILSG